MTDIQRKAIDHTVRDLNILGFNISDKEIHKVKEYCLRKMRAAGKSEDYFEFLFPDALKEYVLQESVNEICFTCMMEVEDVQFMFKESLR